MFDPVSQGLAAVSARSGLASPLVFLAGAVSSVGPCVAPRFIAIAGMTAGKSRAKSALLVLAFVLGLCATYATFGAVSSLLGRVTELSTYVYLAVALALAGAGIRALWRGETRCEHAHEDGARAGGAGAAFLLGASFALVLSPCCTPLVLGIVAYTSTSGSPAYASALLACFAAGHALPVFAVALGVNRLTTWLARYDVRQAASVVSATLMLGLAGYYFALA